MRSAIRPLLSSLLIASAALSVARAADPSEADTQPDARMLRYPDVSSTHLAFVYAADIWLVPREGGVASPLASPAGSEMFPRFSPDGKQLAFVGNYEGNKDLYVLPIAGGVAARVTHHPVSELVSDWTPDGKLLFSSTHEAWHKLAQAVG